MGAERRVMPRAIRRGAARGAVRWWSPAAARAGAPAGPARWWVGAGSQHHRPSSSSAGPGAGACRHSERQERLDRFAAAMELSRAPAPAAPARDGASTIRERRGKSRRGGIWWPDGDSPAPQPPTGEQRAASRERFAAAMSLTRAPPPQPRDPAMASKPGGFGFNALMDELDQLSDRSHSHYPLFERTIFEHRQQASEAAEPPSTPLHDSDGGLDLATAPQCGDEPASAPQRRDYWPAAELRMLREARAELAQDPFPSSDSGTRLEAAEWDSISGWLAMQGYNRSGPECAAAAAADDAALAAAAGAPAPASPIAAQTAGTAAAATPSAAEKQESEQEALLQHHSEETLGMVQRLAEGGRLRPLLSEADANIAAELERGAAAAVRAAVASHAATDHATPFDDTSHVSELPTRVEAAAAQLQHRSGLLEREREVRIMLLAALAAEHLLIFGPPGTGKTTLCREAASLLGSGSAPFERLISKRRSFSNWSCLPSC